MTATRQNGATRSATPASNTPASSTTAGVRRRGRPRGSGRSKHGTPMSQIQPIVMSARLTAELAKIAAEIESQPEDTNSVEVEEDIGEADVQAETTYTTRGRRVNTVKYNEAIAAQMQDSHGDEDDESGERNAPTPAVRPSGLKLVFKGLNNTKPTMTRTGTSTQHEMSIEEFVDTIQDTVIRLFHAMEAQQKVQTELFQIFMPNPNPELAAMELNDIEAPWTSKDLFHMYIYAFYKGNTNICDLVVDNWIREFQRLDSIQAGKSPWKKNCSIYKAHEERNAPPNDNGDPKLHRNVHFIDLALLSELYQHTEPDCGARLMWADTIALHGGRVEARLETAAMKKEKWHPELIWDVLQTSLRITRVRRTLKIEERNPQEWCNRYHQHGKNSPAQACYREIAQQPAQEHIVVESDGDESGESDEDEDGYEDATLGAQMVLETPTQEGGGTEKHVAFA